MPPQQYGTLVATPPPGSAAPEVRPATWQDLVTAEAKRHGIDPRLAIAIAETESSFNPAAVSSAGARGIMQLMPKTAARLKVDPNDPVQNIRGGLAELKALLDANQGDVVKALRLYNGSPQASPEATEPYVQAVLGRLQRSGQAAPAGPRRGGVPAGTPRTAPAMVAAPPEPETPAGATAAATPAAAEPDLPWWQDVLSAVDIRTRRGRRNVAGAVGGAGGAIAGAPLLPFTGPIGPATTAVLGAGTAGMLVEAGEQVVEGAANALVGRPPTSVLEPGTIGAAGAEQMGYEMGGQIFLWPFKALGRRLIMSKVAKTAHAGLQATRKATMQQLDNALAAASASASDLKLGISQTVGYARRRAADALRETRKGAQAGMRTARGEAETIIGKPPDDVLSVARRETAEQIRAAREAKRVGVQTAEQRAAERTAAAGQPLEPLIAQAPSTAQASRAAHEVLMGPATEARNLIGQEVEAAARSGPDVDIRALKAEAQQILERLKPPEKTFPRRVAEPEATELSAAGTPVGKAADAAVRQKALVELERKAAAGDRRAADDLLVLQAEVSAAQEAARSETLKHPAMGVISRILNADDTVPFFDAHLWKSELQNALQGTYDKAVKKQVTSITQRLTSSLREALAGHEPYNAATARYAEIVPLYTKGHAAQLRRAAIDDPESLIRRINPNAPTATRMLRDVLVGMSAEAGRAAEGQRAWDLVRSAWTSSKVISGGIEKLESNLAKLPKEFTDIFYGDASGRQIHQNLQTIASAYKAAVQAGEREIAGAKEAGRVSVEAAQRAGRMTLEEAQRALAQRHGAAATRIEQARAAGESAIETTRRVGRRQIDEAVQEGLTARRQAAQELLALRSKRRDARLPTDEEVRFAASRLAKGVLTPEQVGADVVRAIAIRGYWGFLSLMRLARGPRSKELIEWAAYSTPNTQRLVRALTTPYAGMAAADVFRLSGIPPEPEMLQAAPIVVGTPPPR